MIELDYWKLLVQKSDKPLLAQVIDYIDGQWIIEYDSDGSIHDYWSLEEIEELFEEWMPPMLLYCKTGKSRFCLNYRSGFYWVDEVGLPIWLDSSWNNLTIEEIKRACKLKVFW